MKMLVISDTHIPVTADQLPQVILKEAQTCDYCFHAGDLVEYNIIEELSKLTTVHAVYGNMDDGNTKKRLPSKKIVTIEGVTFALIHGSGSLINIISTVTDAFQNDLDKINILIFGHSHLPTDQEINGRIYFNPGSPTDKIYAPYCSYGIIELKDGKIIRRIVKIG